MPNTRNHARLLAGLVTLAAGVAAAGSTQAEAFVAATGLTLSTDVDHTLSTLPFSFSQSTAFDDVRNNLFHTTAGGTFVEGRSSVSAGFDPSARPFNNLEVDLGISLEKGLVASEHGTTATAGFAQSEMHDTLTISGTAATPEQMILHRMLELRADGSGDAFQIVGRDTVSGSASASFSSNGTITSIFETNPLLSFSIFATPSQTNTTGGGPVDEFVDFSIPVFLNAATDVDISLLNQFDFQLTDLDVDGRGNAGQGFIQMNSNARFFGDAFITDTEGAAVCGVTIAAESGAFWGSIPACQGDGRGGGKVGGVPEPASWALMIAGFGGMGAMLRRRRDFAALAQAS